MNNSIYQTTEFKRVGHDQTVERLAVVFGLNVADFDTTSLKNSGVSDVTVGMNGGVAAGLERQMPRRVSVSRDFYVK